MPATLDETRDTFDRELSAKGHPMTWTRDGDVFRGKCRTCTAPIAISRHGQVADGPVPVVFGDSPSGILPCPGRKR